MAISVKRKWSNKNGILSGAYIKEAIEKHFVINLRAKRNIDVKIVVT